MNKLNSKNWQRVRVSHKNKTLTFTNDTTYKTITECNNDIKSTQYIAINLKHLTDFVSEGYVVTNTNSQETIKNVTTEATQSENVKEVKQEQTEVKKAKVDPIKLFLASPPRQKSHKPFDYSKNWESYESKGRPRAERELDKQIAEYR